MYSLAPLCSNFIIRACAASSGEYILTVKVLVASLTILIGVSNISSAVSQSFPPLVTLPVAFVASSGSVENSNEAPPTPAKGIEVLKSIGKPTAGLLTMLSK